VLIDDDGIELLDESECRRLLATVTFGRVGITMGALPVILPVNYAVIDGDLVFATSGGTKLRAALRNAVIAFEVDAIDPRTRTGWSVLAVGQCAELTDGPAYAAARAEGPVPFAAGRDHFVRLIPEFLSGRRIGPHAHLVPMVGVAGPDAVAG
jgi:hypothetical protein